jgi:hypothetical protein
LIDLFQADVTVIAGILIFLTIGQAEAKSKEAQFTQQNRVFISILATMASLIACAGFALFEINLLVAKWLFVVGQFAVATTVMVILPRPRLWDKKQHI